MIAATKTSPARLHLFPVRAPISYVVQDSRVKGGSSERLELVYREQAPRLWRALVASFGNPEVASDALHEAFAQAAERGDALRTPERWVWTAAFRIATGEARERSRRDQLSKAGDMVEASAEASDLLEALAELSPRQRVALVLHYYGGYRTREIGQFLGCSAATVRVHLSVGRKRLRAILETDDD